MKVAPKSEARRKITVGRASVSWGPRAYGGPNVTASAAVEAIDDLVADVLQAQVEINAATKEKPLPYGDEPSGKGTGMSSAAETIAQAVAGNERYGWNNPEAYRGIADDVLIALYQAGWRVIRDDAGEPSGPGTG